MLTYLLLGAAALPEAELRTVTLSDRHIRAGDIARAPGLEAVVIGTLPDGRDSVVIDKAAAHRLLRNRLPHRQFTLHFTDRIAVTHTAPVDARGCVRAASDLAAGEPVLSDNVEPTPCTGNRPTASLGYDSARALPIARQPIASGTYLGPLRAPAAAPLPAGETMTLRFATGPVVVERSVATLQPAFAGKRVFVRTEDNDVISAVVAAEREGSKP